MPTCKHCNQKTWWIKNITEGVERFDMVQPGANKIYLKTSTDNEGKYPVPVAKLIETFQPHYAVCPNRPTRQQQQKTEEQPKDDNNNF